MRALLLVAHGSKRSAANEEVIALAEAIAGRTQATFDAVVAGFMQFASPSITEQIDALVDRGVDEIVVFPYFISSGSHVLSDIPEQVETARKQNPDVTFRLLPHLGKLSGIADYLASQVIQD